MKLTNHIFKSLYSNKNLLFYLLLLFIFFAGYAVFFAKNGFLLFGDFNPAVAKTQFMYAWSPGNLGYDYSSYLTPAAFGAFSFYLIKFLGLYFGSQVAFLFPLVYFLTTIYWVSIKVFKTRPFLSFIIGLLSIFNPLTLGYIFYGGVDITFVGFSSILLSFVFLYSALQKSKIDIRYLIAAAFMSGFTTSLVYFFIFCLILVVYFIFEIFLIKNKKFVLFNFLTFGIMVFLINSYWLIPFSYSLLFNNAANLVLSNNAGVSVLNSLMPFATLTKTISLYYYGALQENFQFGNFLDIIMMVFLALLLFFSGFGSNFTDKTKKKILLFSILLFAVVLFLAKGPNEPLGKVFVYAFKYVPFFQGFRTYIRFCIVMFICYLVITNLLFDRFRSNKYIENTLALLLTVIIIYSGYHFIYLKREGVVPVSLPAAYQNLLDKPDQSDSLMIDAPYYTYNQAHDWGISSIVSHMGYRYFWYSYTGYIAPNDMRRYVIETYNGLRGRSARYVANVGAIFNVGDILLHKDKNTNKNILSSSENLLDQALKEQVIYKKADNKNFTLYSTSINYYLPHIYVPNDPIISDSDFRNINSLLENNDFYKGNAFYLTSQNKGLSITSLPKTASVPSIEYKKISPVKYRLLIHRATGSFPLVFSESFNKDWKIYQANVSKRKSNINIDSYKSELTNSANQATESEIRSFALSGKISTLGDEKTKMIDPPMIFHSLTESRKIYASNSPSHVSKEVHNVIQNDNLSNGTPLESFSLKEVKASHYVANGYANSWVINPSDFCDKDQCQKNADGSYDFDLVIYFWPQNLIYLGMGLCFIFVFSSLVYLVTHSKQIKC